MYLVVGATGNLGGEVCRRLTAEGKPVRGLVRAKTDQGKRDKLASYGVELVEGDVRVRLPPGAPVVHEDRIWVDLASAMDLVNLSKHFDLMLLTGKDGNTRLIIDALGGRFRQR